MLFDPDDLIRASELADEIRSEWRHTPSIFWMRRIRLRRIWVRLLIDIIAACDRLADSYKVSQPKTSKNIRKSADELRRTLSRGLR